MFEYRLRRRKKRKEDFLQYIEFEICLLLLISRRRKRLLIESKKKEIDNSIAKKVSRLFKAVISRFPDDEKLWLNQIEYFKRMKWNDSINALFTKILMTHSRKPDLWIMAAKWEMEDNNSFDNARKTFQRGVLLNPKSESLWREYFRMELEYIKMIRKRQEVLQLQNIMDTSEENDAVLRGDIVNVVYEKAVEEIPDVEFALSFISICMEFDFAARQADYIIKNIQETFPEKEETMDAVAKLPLKHVKERTAMLKERGLDEKAINKILLKEVCLKYDEAVEKIPTEKMWNFYLEFLFMKLQCTKTEKSKAKVENTIIDKMEKAAEVDCLSMEYYIQWFKMLLKKGEKTRALQVSLNGAHKWNTVEMWSECLSLHIQSRKSLDLTYNLFMEALSNVKEKDTGPIWRLGVDWLTMINPGKLMEFFESGITKKKKISLPLKEMYLETTALRQGIDDARALYRRLKTMGSVALVLYKTMIKIERAQVKPSLTHIRACYEDMVKDHGHNNVDVWLEFMNFESTLAHDPKSFDMLQWRAKKMLQPELVDEFQTRLTIWLTDGKICADKDFAAMDI